MRVNLGIERRGSTSVRLLDHFENHVLNGPGAVQHKFDRAHDLWEQQAHRPGFCQGSSTSALVSESLSRVMRLDDIVKFHTNLPLGPASRSRFTCLDSGDSVDMSDCDVHGAMRGAMDFFWITESAALKLELTAAGSEMADRARDVLGLAYPENKVLIEVKLPAGHLREAFKPTVMDGSVNDAFCAWIAGVAHGFTWRLRERRRGLPELVATKTQLTLECPVTFLGTTRTARPLVTTDILNRK